MNLRLIAAATYGLVEDVMSWMGLPAPSMDQLLTAAASKGRVEDVKRLVENGADVNSVDSEGQTRASGAAGRRGGGQAADTGAGQHSCGLL